MNPEIFDVNLPVNIMHILYEDDYDDGVDDVDDDDDEHHYHDQHDDHDDYDAKMQILGSRVQSASHSSLDCFQIQIVMIIIDHH